jgi:ubiquinone/menaquinone biosynthesis C-methylase UbiE
MAYTAFDRFLARQRFQAALPHVRPGSRVCDVGCGLDAAFLTYAGTHISLGVGLDDQVRAGNHGRWPVIRSDITRGLPLLDAQFDHVLMLAVLEHLGDPEPVLREAFRVLAPAGSLILTWPQSLVDPVLTILHGIKLVSHEMESQEHQPRKPLGELLRILSRTGFCKFFHRRFELGMNNLLVTYKPAA